MAYFKVGRGLSTGTAWLRKTSVRIFGLSVKIGIMDLWNKGISANFSTATYSWKTGNLVDIRIVHQCKESAAIPAWSGIQSSLGTPLCKVARV
jgi:hypothetical protein